MTRPHHLISYSSHPFACRHELARHTESCKKRRASAASPTAAGARSDDANLVAGSRGGRESVNIGAMGSDAAAAAGRIAAGGTASTAPGQQNSAYGGTRSLALATQPLGATAPASRTAADGKEEPQSEGVGEWRGRSHGGYRWVKEENFFCHGD